LVPAIGAHATFSTSSGQSQRQIVDGGSGRGGQQDLTLIYGLGAYSGTVTCDIDWVSGRQSQIVIPSDDLGTVVEIVEEANPSLLSTTAHGSYAINADETVDWIFEWETEYLSDSALDQVTISPSGLPYACTLSRYVLTVGQPDVEHYCSAKPGGGYEHRLVWTDRDCVPNCNYSFTVQSSRVGETNVSSSKQLWIKICPMTQFQ